MTLVTDGKANFIQRYLYSEGKRLGPTPNMKWASGNF